MNDHQNNDVEEVPEEVVQEQLNHYVWKCPISSKETVELRAMAESEIAAKRLILEEVKGKIYRELIIDFFSKPWAVPSVNNTPKAWVYTESIPVFL